MKKGKKNALVGLFSLFSLFSLLSFSLSLSFLNRAALKNKRRRRRSTFLSQFFFNSKKNSPFSKTILFSRTFKSTCMERIVSPKRRSGVFDEKSLSLKNKSTFLSLNFFKTRKRGRTKSPLSRLFLISSSSLEQNAVLYSRFREEDE